MIWNNLRWIATSSASTKELSELDKRMAHFYSTFEARNPYQELIDSAHEGLDKNSSLGVEIAEMLCETKAENVIEVGCGSGKIYNHLLQGNFRGNYTGVEMAPYVIAQNIEKYPTAIWKAGSVYDLSSYPPVYDACLAFFVLEHLIYPEKALSAMLQVLQPGGKLILVFPDFQQTGIMPSQKVGIQYGVGTKEKLKKGKLFDGLISYIEGRTLRNALGKVNDRFGNFVINLEPYCLQKECKSLIPDIDAVYIANKKEVEKWGIEHNKKVTYPNGVEGLFAKTAYMIIEK